MHSAGEQERYHLHGYLYWTDNVGFQRRTIDELKFDDVAPRVDKCVVRNGTTPRTAACHGLWYVTHETGERRLGAVTPLGLVLI